MADAQEYRVHVFSSGVVFLALVGQMIGYPVDRYAALVIVVLIAKTGWELLSDGMRVLLDASLDSETIAQVRAIIEAEPTVTEVRWVVGRNAGRYRFLEADLALRVEDLEKAHAVSQRLERAIREQVPHVERVLIHYEPQVRTHLRYAVPLADAGGTVSQHFGESPYFGSGHGASGRRPDRAPGDTVQPTPGRGKSQGHPRRRVAGRLKDRRRAAARRRPRQGAGLRLCRRWRGDANDQADTLDRAVSEQRN